VTTGRAVQRTQSCDVIARRPSDGGSTVLCGDASGDGNVNATDALHETAGTQHGSGQPPAARAVSPRKPISRLRERSPDFFGTGRGAQLQTGAVVGNERRGAYLTRSILAPPWSLRIEDQAPLTLVAMLRGTACVVHDGAAPSPTLSPVPPETAPQWVIHPDQRSTTVAGEEVGRTGGPSDFAHRRATRRREGQRRTRPGVDTGPTARSFADRNPTSLVLETRGPGTWLVSRSCRYGRPTGASRARLARRFTELVGTPPMQFLTGWRLALTAEPVD